MSGAFFTLTASDTVDDDPHPDLQRCISDLERVIDFPSENGATEFVAKWGENLRALLNAWEAKVAECDRFNRRLNGDS